MANLTATEFGEAVEALVEHHGLERLRDRLTKMNAFTSRRGLNSAGAIADRLYLLSVGLRRPVPATYAFSTLWNEMLGTRLGEDGEQKLEALADQVNACLDAGEAVIAEKEEALDAALAAYRAALAEATGAQVARLDMLMKAVPAVAERLRRPAAPPT
jgi:hypothetical protein